MRVLFHGDSITDAGRDYNYPKNLGNGYPKFAAELISKRHPNTEFDFYNFGTSGSMTETLRHRWQADCIDYDPDVVSILIGVNDTWHGAYVKQWVSDEYYEECYRYCLEELKNKTKAKIMIFEQFLIPPCPILWYARHDLDSKIHITRRLAREYADIFVPLDGIFAAESLHIDPSALAADGIHPTETGAKLIADLYADAFDKVIPRF